MPSRTASMDLGKQWTQHWPAGRLLGQWWHPWSSVWPWRPGSWFSSTRRRRISTRRSTAGVMPACRGSTPHRRIGAASARTPDGPSGSSTSRCSLRGRRRRDAGDGSNAALLILSNGTGSGRAGGDGVALAVGTGRHQPVGCPFERVGDSMHNALGRGGWGAVLIRTDATTCWSIAPPAPTAAPAALVVGGHAPAKTWRYDDDEVAYTAAVSWQNGSDSSVLYRRERPKPVVDDETGHLSALFNGAWPCHVGAEDDDSLDGTQTYTLVTDVRVGARGRRQL